MSTRGRERLSLSYPRVLRRYDVRRLVNTGVDKRGRPVGPFESIKDARRECRHRIRLLRAQPDPASQALAELLERCKRSRPCGSVACFRCARVRRIRHSATILQFLAAYPLTDLRLLTLINPADAIAPGQLHTLGPMKLIARTRRQLERVGVAKKAVFLIGGVDGEWDRGWSLYQPHVHMVAFGVTAHQLAQLIKPWPKHARVRMRKRRDPIDDLPRVVAYLEKSFWPAIARKNNPAGIQPHKKRRPDPAIEAEVLHWLHQQSASSLRLMFGAKTYGGAVMKT